jgi:hypothetical protein
MVDARPNYAFRDDGYPRGSFAVKVRGVDWLLFPSRFESGSLHKCNRHFIALPLQKEN